ncbi:MAG TPA: alpha-amylase family glycosyl hydrolase, partial [Deinococcales bacterium]|nr:alpha-amylase family glycosyl hydrolase [Deinococcales bacterium]
MNQPSDNPQAHPWWQRGIIYQVYPRSFQDSNDDGVGDLPGITGRLDYLQWLGVDAVWLSPIFPSPMADFGYDVADYCGVDPIFGTLADLDDLVARAHERGLKVLLDFVPNHSSDEHDWFVQSRSSRGNPKREWYVWRDPAPDGGPPNNWDSYFGGPAWTLDEVTGQYYLHLFHRKQPDLNWRNPAVVAAMLDAMRFWLARGIDGFRVDVLWMLLKDPEFRDNPPNPAWREGDIPSGRQLRVHTEGLEETHGLIRQMRAVVDEFPERVMIGEIYLPLERLVRYYGLDLDEAHLPFNFHLLQQREWSAGALRALVEHYEAVLPPGAWPNWVLGNHDNSRIASRLGPQVARVAQMLLLTLRGTPTLYYGDEIGMRDVPVPPELTQDPQGKFAYEHSRDPERSPMQWDATRNAGFSAGDPWLPLAADYRAVNVEAARADERS